jgi:hypothetical protein
MKKKIKLTMLGLAFVTANVALAKVGDKIQNNCRLSDVTDETRYAGAAQYGPSLKLPYNTVLVTFNCDKPMTVSEGMIVESPFIMAFSGKLKKELTNVAQSGKAIPVVFTDEGYTVSPAKIGTIENFPDANEASYRVRGASTYAFDKEAQYRYLDQVLDQVGAVRVPEMAVNSKDPTDTRLSWKKTFHFLALAGDFEITITQKGPYFFRVWQIPIVEVNMACVRTATEMVQGVGAPHELTVEDSKVLRSLIGDSLTVNGGDFTQQIDCRNSSCLVTISRNK